ncbi:hypothetical protein JOB18_008908, partial [Solea senegalensis]
TRSRSQDQDQDQEEDGEQRGQDQDQEPEPGSGPGPGGGRGAAGTDSVVGVVVSALAFEPRRPRFETHMEQASFWSFSCFSCARLFSGFSGLLPQSINHLPLWPALEGRGGCCAKLSCHKVIGGVHPGLFATPFKTCKTLMKVIST